MSRQAILHSLRPAATRTLIAASIGATAYALADSDRIAQAKTAFTGLRAHVADAYTLKLDAAAAKEAKGAVASELGIDFQTAVTHPLTLAPASAPELSLVGVGVRTVSFISFKVYSAAFYANDYSLRRLQAVPGWSAYTPADLAGPDGEKLVQALLDVPTAVAVRIVPVRNTDFGHLRDGFTRTLLARAKDARKAGTLTPADDDAIAAGIQQLKAVFPAGSVPKGKVLTIVRTTDGHLAVEYEGKVLGNVANQWVADSMIRAYFAPAPISPPLRDSVSQGFQRYFEQK